MNFEQKKNHLKSRNVGIPCINSAPIFFYTNYFEVLLSQQILDTFLEYKVLQKLKFSKNVNNKNVLLKMILFNENGILLQKIILTYSEKKMF